MKRIQHIISALFGVLLLLSWGCTGDFDEINRNPSEATNEELQRENYKIGTNIRGLQNLVIPVQEHRYQFNESLTGNAFAGYMAETPDGWKEKFSTFNPSAAPAVTAETIELQAAKTPNDIRDNFEFGSTDLVYCDPNSPAAVGYRCDYEAWEAPAPILHYVGFNLYSGWFTNVALRRAFTYGVDREAMTSAVYNGFAQAATLPCSPASDLYDAQLAAQYAYQRLALELAHVGDFGVLRGDHAERDLHVRLGEVDLLLALVGDGEVGQRDVHLVGREHIHTGGRIDGRVLDLHAQILGETLGEDDVVAGVLAVLVDVAERGLVGSFRYES